MPDETITAVTAAKIGQVMGDYYYIYTQLGGLGYLPLENRNIAQLTTLQSLAMFLDESVRGPVLDALSNTIRSQVLKSSVSTGGM